MSRKTLGTVTQEDAFERTKDYILRKQNGEIPSLRTRYPVANELLFDGIEWQWLVTVAALPSVGKTFLISKIIEDAISFDPTIDILYLNYEMSADRLLQRDIAARAGVTVKQLLGIGNNALSKPQALAAITDYYKAMPKQRVLYVPQRGTPREIKEFIHQYIENNIKPNKRKLVVALDHSLLAVVSDTKNGLIDLNNALVEVKNSYKYVIVLVAQQMNREIKNKENRRDPDKNLFLHYPQESDIFGSDAPLQSSDVMVMLHCPAKLGLKKYGPDKWDVKNGRGDLYIYAHWKKIRDDNNFYWVTRFWNEGGNLLEDDWKSSELGD